MFCINCGKQVNDTDPFCPFCGTKLDNNSANNAQPEQASSQIEELTPVESTPVEQPAVEQPVAETPAVTPTPEVAQPEAPVEQPAVEQPIAPAPETPVAAPTPEVAVTPTPGAQAQPVQPAPVQQPANNKGKNNTLILIIILAIVIIVGVVVIGKTFISTKETPAPTTPSSEPNAQEVADTTEKTESYLGYTFTIPDGFTTKIDSKFGLIISDNNVAYSILVDFTNDYSKYREALIAKYPTQAADLEKTVGTRKFLIGKVTGTDGATGSEYITAANGNSSFVGMVLNRNNTVEYNDYKVLANILDSSKESGSTFAAGDAKDPGKDGPIMFEITKDSFEFGEK